MKVGVKVINESSNPLPKYVNKSRKEIAHIIDQTKF